MPAIFEKTHPLLPPVVCYLLGLVCAHAYAWYFPPFLLAGTVLLIISLLWGGIKGRFPIPLLCLALFVFAAGWLGCLRAQPLPENHIALLADHRYHLMEIEISQASQPNKYGWQVMGQVLSLDGRPAQGGMELRGGHKYPPPQVGQIIQARLRPRPMVNFANPGSPDWAWLRAQEDVHASASLNSKSDMRVVARNDGLALQVERWRQNWNQLLEELPPGDARGLIRAISLGQRAEPDTRLRNNFAELGIAHLLAISGLHLGLIWGFFFFGFKLLLGRFPKILLHLRAARLAASLAFLPTLFYALLGGASLPTLRALIMAACLVAGLWLNRTYQVVGGLSLAACIICLLWPESLFSISFQLSFAAVCAIIWVAAPLVRYLKKRLGRFRKLAWLVGLLAFSGAIELFLWPLTAQTFHQIPWLSLPANALFIPLIGFILLPLGLLAGFAGLVWPAAGTALMQAAWLVAELTLYLVKALASLPFAVSYTAGPTPQVSLLIYLAWLVIFLLSGAKRFYLAAIPLLAAILLWAMPEDKGFITGRMQAWVLDVGQGQSVVVKLPDERIMVVDCGISGSMDPGQQIVAPFLWQKGIRQVDILVASHPHPDHFSGLAFLLRWFNPRELWVTGYEEEGDYLSLLRLAQERQVQVYSLRAPHVKDVGGGQIKVLWPPAQPPYKSGNNLSLWLGIGQGENWLWLPGDNGPQVEKRQRGFPAGHNILLAPHHGGKGSCSMELMRELLPQTVIFSTGCMNIHGMPRADSLANASRIGARILTTGNNGCVSLQSMEDGWRVDASLALPRPCTWNYGG